MDRPTHDVVRAVACLEPLQRIAEVLVLRELALAFEPRRRGAHEVLDGQHRVLAALLGQQLAHLGHDVRGPGVAVLVLHGLARVRVGRVPLAVRVGQRGSDAAQRLELGSAKDREAFGHVRAPVRRSPAVWPFAREGVLTTPCFARL